MFRRVLGGSLACSIGAALLASQPALAAAPHTVQPGETLWGISAANNLTTRTVAVYNGLPETAGLLVGTTIYVPTVGEGASVLASGTPAVAPPPTPGTAAPTSGTTQPTSGTTQTTTGATQTTGSGATGSAATTTASPAPGTGQVPSPYGELHLAAAAADAWNRMRTEAMSTFGTDLYPGGPLSAYRTYQQQAELYQAFLAGYGAPANPPGTSSHELGTAVDLPSPSMRSVIDQIGWKYGWSKIHAPGEWWHVDYGGG